MRFSIFLCFFLRMRFRRFLISDPMTACEGTRDDPIGPTRATRTEHPPTGLVFCVQPAEELDMEVDVSPQQILRSLRHLEGHHVSVHLGDGSRLDCELVSAARRGASTVWVHDGIDDRFVPVGDIADVREIA